MLPKDKCCPAANLQSHDVETGSSSVCKEATGIHCPGQAEIMLLCCCVSLESTPQLTPHPKTLRINRFLLPNNQLVMLPHRPRRLVRAISSSTDQRKPISSSLPGTGLPKGPYQQVTSQCLQTWSLLAGWMAGTATGHGIEEVSVGLSSDR